MTNMACKHVARVLMDAAADPTSVTSVAPSAASTVAGTQEEADATADDVVMASQA